MELTPHEHVLPDGTTVNVRAVRDDDRDRLLAMWARTSPASRHARFHGSFRLDASNVGRFTDLDPTTQFAVVATLGRAESERIIGVARYVRERHAPEQAEFAALVEDAHQSRGVGSELVRHVAQAAEVDGITHISGEILADNARMLNLVRELGLEYRSARDGGGVVRSDLDTSRTERFLTVVAERERGAAEAALERFFRPERVAVVGASRDPDAIGGLVFANLLHGGFTGVIYPVNPYTDHVQGVAAYPSLGSCPDVPDLVVVCVPAPAVGEVVDEAGQLGVRAVCVISAGFAETDDEGQERERDLMQRARSHGLRVIGPNGMGVSNGQPDMRMNATLSTTFPPAGRVSMSSQSGALGLAVLEHVTWLGLGMSTFVSVGNKADISGNDLLLFWEQDPDTDVILLYLESFGNPRKFSRIARRISRRKPIVAVKSGRTAAGARAAAGSASGRFSTDGPPRARGRPGAVDALFRQTGVIRTDTLEELFDVATLLSCQDVPRGNRVAVLTNAGGPGILAADALESNGLVIPTLSEATMAALRSVLADRARVSNPIDLLPSASMDRYRAALEVLAEADEVDTIFVIFIPTAVVEVSSVASTLAEADRALPEGVAIVSVLMSASGRPAELAGAGIPSFPFPETAAKALGRVTSYGAWRRRPLGEVVEPAGLERDRARGIVEAALGRSDARGHQLPAAEAEALLAAYGVTVGDGERGDDAVEMVIGVSHDPSFGPIVLTGMGGPLAELVGDVATRITPLTDVDVAEMLDDLRTAPLLGGYGGSAPRVRGDGSSPADVPALEDLLFRVNAMVEDLPEIVELDLDPVLVRPDGGGVAIADVRLRLAAT